MIQSLLFPRILTNLSGLVLLQCIGTVCWKCALKCVRAIGILVVLINFTSFCTKWILRISDPVVPLLSHESFPPSFPNEGRWTNNNQQPMKSSSITSWFNVTHFEFISPQRRCLFPLHSDKNLIKSTALNHSLKYETRQHVQRYPIKHLLYWIYRWAEPSNRRIAIIYSGICEVAFNKGFISTQNVFLHLL